MINGRILPGAQPLDEHHGPVGIVVSPDGSLSAPGCHWLFAAGDGEGRCTGGYGILCLTTPGARGGLHITLTPEGLRHFGDRFHAMASNLEASAARAAADVLERAKGAGK